MRKCSSVVLLFITFNILLLVTIRNKYESLIPNIPLQNSSIQSLDRTHQQNVTQEWTYSININKNLFSKRKEHMDELCKNKKQQSSKKLRSDPTPLFVLKDYNVVWCPVFKAGTSTWISILLDLYSPSEVDLNFTAGIILFIFLRFFKLKRFLFSRQKRKKFKKNTKTLVEYEWVEQ